MNNKGEGCYLCSMSPYPDMNKQNMMKVPLDQSTSINLRVVNFLTYMFLTYVNLELSHKKSNLQSYKTAFCSLCL